MTGYDELRQDVVNEIVGVLTDDGVAVDERIRRAMAINATLHEQQAAVDKLAALAASETSAATSHLEDAGFVRWTPPTRSPLLHSTYAELQRVVARAAAISYLLDQLAPRWAAWPNKPLIDVLKTTQRGQLEQIAKALHEAGLHDLDCFTNGVRGGG